MNNDALPASKPSYKIAIWQFNAAQARWLSFLGLFLLTLVVFGSSIFTTESVVVSSADDGDLVQQFIYWREFGFGELANGNLALWNPHNFGGAPYFAGFQSALLYPLNWVYLVLPLAKAINTGIALHVFLAGVFMYLWTERRCLHPLACFLSAVLWMFCAPHFLHIYAGHLPNVCTLIWAPLLFLAIDGMFEKPSLGWVLLGSFTVAMQILAGHPQYVFYTAVAAGTYCLLHFVKAPHRLRVAFGLGMFCVGAVLLSAIQFFPGLAASKEAVRAGGVSLQFASIFSFPPENFVTLIAPWFFGGFKAAPYWGRCYLWEMSAFFGVTGIVLAGYGAVFRKLPQRRFEISMALILFFLALGARTFLFRFLYEWLPGFDQFRGQSKFIFLAVMFLVMLAAIGFDQLLKQASIAKRLSMIVAAIGVALLIASFAIRSSSDNVWMQVAAFVLRSNEGALPAKAYESAKFPALVRPNTAQALIVPAASLLAIAGVLFLSRRSPKVLPAIAIIAVLEMLLFVRGAWASFPLHEAYPADVTAWVKNHPGDHRIFNSRYQDLAMSLNGYELWGYDPGVLRRYAQFVALTQDLPIDRADQYTPISKAPPLLALLRAKFALMREGTNLNVLEFPTAPLPHVKLMSRYQIKKTRDDIFALLKNSDFDFRNELILESAPSPEPDPQGAEGQVKIIDSSSDHLTIEAHLPSAALLLVTDTYSKDWHATPLAGSSQPIYNVMPADYCLRAIPLGAGDHKLRLEYLPSSFVIGRMTTCVGLILFLGTFVFWMRHRKNLGKTCV